MVDVIQEVVHKWDTITYASRALPELWLPSCFVSGTSSARLRKEFRYLVALQLLGSIARKARLIFVLLRL